MFIPRKALIATAMVASVLGGGAIGATVFQAGTSAAQTSSTTTTPSTGSSATAGTFHPNEDPTHEAGESAAREAQEDAGQVPTIP